MVSKITSKAVLDILNCDTIYPDLTDTYSMNSLFLSTLGGSLYGSDYSYDTCIPIT